ncbi:hypothetical protein N0V86_008199 [Didymella sp. IMI 355093]|nr:hypothetical protein N0V86_008199 [Didymella sp. IMI 355093]
MPCPFAAVDATDLPIAVEIDDIPDRIRQDIFDRLHWIVFGPQSDITVQDGNALTPFANHAIGPESIADPPVSRITVRIQVCENKSSMDRTEEEEYRYQPPEPLVIEKRNGAPILLKEFISQVHPFLNANKDDIYRCEDENYSQPTELEDGTKFDGVDPAEFDGANEYEDEDQPTEPNLFMRSGNIPTGSKFFFDDAQFNEADTNDFEVYIGLFVEGNMGIPSDQFWRHRASAYDPLTTKSL